MGLKKANLKKMKRESHSVVSDSLQPHRLYSPWDSPGQNTGVGSLSLLQGIFPIQGSNPGVPHCRWILYQLSHKGSPRILECVAYPFLQWIFPTQELNQGLLRQGLLHQRWIFGAGALGRPRGMEWGGRREEGSGWGTHVYLWWIHFDIWQN